MGEDIEASCHEGEDSSKNLKNISKKETRAKKKKSGVFDFLIPHTLNNESLDSATRVQLLALEEINKKIERIEKELMKKEKREKTSGG